MKNIKSFRSAIIIGLISLAMLFNSCGGSREDASKADKDKFRFDSLKNTEEASALNDTTRADGNSRSIKIKPALMAYSYYPEMERNVSQDINVFVSVNKTIEALKDTLIKIVSMDRQVMKHVSAKDSVVSINLTYYKFLKIELIDPEKSFEIIKIHENDSQEITASGDYRWHWTVKPITNKAETRLIIKVAAIKPSGEKQTIADRNIYIKIKIEKKQFFRDMILYLYDNVGYVITAILVPLIAYFGKRYFDKKKGKKPRKKKI